MHGLRLSCLAIFQKDRRRVLGCSPVFLFKKHTGNETRCVLLATTCFWGSYINDNRRRGILCNADFQISSDSYIDMYIKESYEVTYFSVRQLVRPLVRQEYVASLALQKNIRCKEVTSCGSPKKFHLRMSFWRKSLVRQHVYLEISTIVWRKVRLWNL